MRARSFLISLLGVNLGFHLLRFPHMILDNGGGAYLILFILLLILLALPMLITERILDRKLEQINLKSLMIIRSGNINQLWGRSFVMVWYGLRMSLLCCFVWCFLYVGSKAGLLTAYSLWDLLTRGLSPGDVSYDPNVSVGPIGALLWSTACFISSSRLRLKFYKISNLYLLPFCFSVLFFIMIRILLSINEFSGLKALFYPDFDALSYTSLLRAVGHVLVSLFIRIKFYNFLKLPKDADRIEVFINAILQGLAIAVLVGIIAIPMIEEVSETAYGLNWVFAILPRWLSYGEFGLYYRFLYFLSLCILFFHLSVISSDLFGHNLETVYTKYRNNFSLKKYGSLVILLNTSMLVYFQGRIQGWAGQSFVMSVDRFTIDLIVPALCLMMILLVFYYTKKEERELVFAKQQVFFHNKFFFGIWEWMAKLFVPVLILSAWLLAWFKPV